MYKYRICIKYHIYICIDLHIIWFTFITYSFVQYISKILTKKYFSNIFFDTEDIFDISYVYSKYNMHQ